MKESTKARSVAYGKENKILPSASKEPVEGVAQKKLVLKPTKKKATNFIVQKPLPFATKTSLYDEHWALKQERGQWMIDRLHGNGTWFLQVLSSGSTIYWFQRMNMDTFFQQRERQVNFKTVIILIV